VNEYTKFDIPLYSGRQVWHQVTYERSPERGMVSVQTSGGRVLPRYEKGALQVINALNPLYRDMGNYLWSGELETDDRKRNKLGSWLCGGLRDVVERQERKRKWKDNAITLIPYALLEVRWINPPTGGSRPRLYEYKDLAASIKSDADNWQRDHMEKWNFLQDKLTEWMNSAEQPIYDWMRKVKSRE